MMKKIVIFLLFFSYWANAQYNAWQHIFGVSGSTEAMRITSGGSVGIGTSSPVAELQVNKSSDVTFALSKMRFAKAIRISNFLLLVMGLKENI